MKIFTGRDWAQSGVAQLFTKIKGNGYHIMYLSARAIGQAGYYSKKNISLVSQLISLQLEGAKLLMPSLVDSPLYLTFY